MLIRILSVIFCCLVTPVPAGADELAEAGLTLCEKVKSCALAQVAEEDLTPQAREMMQPMLDSMCAQVQGAASNVPVGHPLYAPAVACLQSMNSLSCEMMQDTVQARTAACETFENLARQSGTGS
jgi:hypothetical protein